MSPYLLLPLVSATACLGVMMIVFLIAIKLKNNGIVDVFWSYNFLVIAAIVYFLADGFEPRKMMVCAITTLWSIRLGTYILIRVFGHIKEEEGRYKQLRAEWGNSPNGKWLGFYIMQAVSNVWLAIPFFLIALNKNETVSMLEYIGAALWLVCIIGEGTADLQLSLFKKNPANKGSLCQYGLWNYSRHPNYFFQFMIWVSVFIFALSSPYGWISVICPLSIGFLLFKVTGIPVTEEQAIRSKGELYKEYQRTTSAFIPWFKKK